MSVSNNFCRTLVKICAATRDPLGLKLPINPPNPIFHDRTEAGEILADRLTKYAGRRDVIVLALPRGGVVVAATVARRLRAPLDVLIVRRLGVPGYYEQAMGAVASGGTRVLDNRLIAALKIPDEEIDAATAVEREEIERRSRLYRGDKPEADLHGLTVVLVDDGVATGTTMGAAIAALRKRAPRRIVVAVPTMARSTYHEIETKADELVDVIAPERFESIGQWYEKFPQASDEQVQDLLGLYGAKGQFPERKNSRRRHVPRGRNLRT